MKRQRLNTSELEKLKIGVTLAIPFLLLILVSCKVNSHSFVGKKFFIDKSEVGDFYKSKKLDALLTIKDYNYFEPDYVGTSFENYHVINIVAQNETSQKMHYLLFFDNNDILCDTIKVPLHEIYALNVEFENKSNKGIAIGTFNENETHFKIREIYEMGNKFNLKRLSNDTKIIKCPLPIALLSEENEGIEDYFKYSVDYQDSNSMRQTAVSQKNKAVEINSNNWVFNPKLIGNKIEGNLQKSALIHLLQNAFKREIEQAYNFDVFDSDNLELLSFYDYPNFHFGGLDFNTYYAKIEYEEAEYELVFITNTDKMEDYASLILYEKLNSEVMYSRNSKIKFPIIELSYVYQGKEAKSQQFIVENGLFLDYFSDNTPVNKFWNAAWGVENTYIQETKNTNLAEYQSTGKITNYLKSGIWEEKRYSIEYKRPIFTSGNYDNGLKQGIFSESITFPNFESALVYSGDYKNGLKTGSWKMIFKDSIIFKNEFIPTNYSEIFHLKTDVKKLDKKNNQSISDKWYGFYSLKSAKMDPISNKMKRFTFYVNVVKDHIYVNVDAANLVDFWCEGEYFITDYSDNFIYCKGICDENSLHDFQLRTENGLFFIKSDFFGFKDWMLVKREID